MSSSRTTTVLRQATPGCRIEPFQLADGRRIDLYVTGPEDGPVLVFHHGTPGSAVRDREMLDAAHERGVRFLSVSRPGYGGSTREPGRDVAAAADDLAEVLAALGIERCIVGGGSGGGPHALACAARLDAVRAAIVVAGVAPYDADGLDFLDGMGEGNVEEFTAALAGEGTLREWLIGAAEEHRGASVDGLLEAMDTLLPDVDRSALTGEFAQDVLANVDEALRNGVDGWLDDDLAFIRPWGFDLDEISVPTSIWHGTDDLFSPFAHGRWLAANVPGAMPHLLEGEGHLSMWTQHLPAMLDEALDAGGLG